MATNLLRTRSGSFRPSFARHRLAAMLLLLALSAGGPAHGAEAEKTWNFQGTRKPDEELKVTRIIRLTHPLVHADQVSFWYSAHYAYNADGTRIMYFEATKAEGDAAAWNRLGQDQRLEEVDDVEGLSGERSSHKTRDFERRLFRRLF